MTGWCVTAGDSTIRGLSLVGFSDSAIVLESGNGECDRGQLPGARPVGDRCRPESAGDHAAGLVVQHHRRRLGRARECDLRQLRGWGPHRARRRDELGHRQSGRRQSDRHVPRWPAGDRQRRFRDRRRGRRGEQLGTARAGIRQRRLGERGPRDQRDGRSRRASRSRIISSAWPSTAGRRSATRAMASSSNDAPATLIGGTDPGERNVIAANRGNGIATSGDTTGLVVAGNSIGTDASGLLQLGNQRERGLPGLFDQHDRRHRRRRGERHRVQRVGPGRRGRAAGGRGGPEHHPLQLDRRERRAGDQLRQRADAESRPGYARAERLSELPGALARPGQRGRARRSTGRSSRAPTRPTSSSSSPARSRIPRATGRGRSSSAR